MPAENAKALEVVDLQKRYPNGVEALRGVSITIEPGDFFGLLGPNGAGKSTTIEPRPGRAIEWRRSERPTNAVGSERTPDATVASTSAAAERSCGHCSPTDWL
jgi:ABC-type phosphate/phosphonate transport system ATPase subunit